MNEYYLYYNHLYRNNNIHLLSCGNNLSKHKRILQVIVFLITKPRYKRNIIV